jgi:hypothetical protein
MMAAQSVNQSGLTRLWFLQDEDDILNWGVPNQIDFIAASFVRKGIDLVNIRKLLGKHAKSIQIISKVGFHAAVLGPVSVWDRLASKICCGLGYEQDDVDIEGGTPTPFTPFPTSHDVELATS